jgi:hypothetical protein
MRETATILLDPDAVAFAPAAADLDTLTMTMRGHLAVLAPVVEQAARKLREGSVPRYTALGCVWEARSRLEAEPSARTGGAVGHARRLARVLDALCGQYEKLGGRS